VRADMSGTVLDDAVLTQADLQKANLRGAAFAMRSSTALTFVMRGWGVPSWPERRYVVPICAARICVWPSSTPPTCPMPVWKLSKA